MQLLSFLEVYSRRTCALAEDVEQGLRWYSACWENAVVFIVKACVWISVNRIMKWMVLYV